MKILILANYDMGLYKFRKELLQRLIAEGNDVTIALPDGEWIDALIELGCTHIPVEVDRRGMNPIKDMKLVCRYWKIIKQIDPSYIFTYTIKPNIYGGIVSGMLKKSYIVNITGMGSAMKSAGVVSKFLQRLYKISLKKAKVVFFQNKGDRDFFITKKLLKQQSILIPGSGVNLQYFRPLEYPGGDTVEFAYIARIMKDKGAEEFFEAAKYIRKKYPQTKFHVCGFCEEDYEHVLNQLSDEGIVQYHGVVSDIRPVLRNIHCTVLPSYHEGMSNVLLESAACARPIIASNIPGCQEIFDEGISGLGVKVKDVEDLKRVFEEFILYPWQKKREMGLAGRRKVEAGFDREKVISAYMSQIKKG